MSRDLPDRNSQAGYLLFADHTESVRAANITVALAICRQKSANAEIRGGAGPIGIRIADASGDTIAYYLTPEDYDRMKRLWKVMP